MRTLLRIPAALTVTTVALALSSCTTASPAPIDAQPGVDVTAAVDAPAAMDVPAVDACPDPLKCYGDLFFPDGSMNPVFLYRRRDGGLSDVACPPAPPGCAVA